MASTYAVSSRPGPMKVGGHMLWQANKFPAEFNQHNQPGNISEAISLLECALGVMLAGMAKADDLNASVRRRNGSAKSKYPEVQLVFDIPPENHGNQKNGQFSYKWEGGRVTLEGLPDVKPQTLYFRVGEKPWRPMFLMQVQRDISTSAQYLAAMGKEKGWSTDAFDRLLAFRVESNPSEDRRNIQDAYTLIAKFRREFGIPGGNFFGVPGKREEKRPKRCKGGRPRTPPAEAARYRRNVRDWKAAKGNGEKMQAFCNERSISVSDLKKAQEYCRSRQNPRWQKTHVKPT